jgi:hypothetical protein
MKATEIKRKEIRQKGVLWANGNGCEMYCVIGKGEYQWYMLSEKTGVHMVSNKGKYGRPFCDERVLAHWSGFKANQNR